MIVEKRLDHSMKIRFKQRYLEYRRIEEAEKGLAAPGGERLSLAPEPIPAEVKAKAKGRGNSVTRPSAVHRTGGRSGRTPAEPCPPAGGSCGSSKGAWRPASTHPWRKKAG